MPAWGTYKKPFAANSPWNSRPLNPVLASSQIGASQFNPAVQAGAYSTGIFLAKPSDGPVDIQPIPGAKGVYDADSETFRESIRIPHWPSDLIPATGTDGHADIVDPELGVIHSLFKLKRVAGNWQAQQYAWSSLKGRGWGDPAHYFQGARAAGVPASAGLIRQHELNDGDTMYRHALAMSLPPENMSASPLYVYPATSTDTNAPTVNTGPIPMGSLLMLPQTFDTSRIHNKQLRKIAETLKHYGAYVVDRNHGTPFLIYVELNPAFSLHDGHVDPNDTTKSLHDIRIALRPVTSAEAWIDGNGVKYIPSKGELNLMSMRGHWKLVEGTIPGQFDTVMQSLVFPAGANQSVMVNASNNIFGRLLWAKPQPGRTYKLQAVCTGGATLKLMLTDCSTATQSVMTPDLKDGESATFKWPENLCSSRMVARSGQQGQSSVSGQLRLLNSNP